MSNEQIMERKQNITTLVTTYYYNNSQILMKKHLELNDLIEKALNKFLYSDLSMQEIENEIINAIYKIKNELDNDFGEEIKKDDTEQNKAKEPSLMNKIKSNIKLQILIDDLNKQNIDYTIIGKASSEIAKNEKVPIGSVSIIVNDKDVDKFLEICKKHGYMVRDISDEPKREMTNGRVVGEPNITAKSEDGNEEVSVTPFDRLEDNSIITKDHYINSDGVHCIKADFYANDLANEIFSSDKVTIDGVTYPIAAPEFTYISSLNGNTPEDKEIVGNLEGIVDTNRIEKIQKLAIDKYASQITTNVAEKKEHNDELSSMMTSENPTINTNTNVNSNAQQKEKPKQFVKTAPATTSENNGGYVSKLAFVFFLLLIVVLFLAGFVLLNM